MKTTNRFLFKAAVFTVTTFFFIVGAFALTSSGIDQAVADVSSFMDTAFNLVIAIGAVIGLIGSVRGYIEGGGPEYPESHHALIFGAVYLKKQKPRNNQISGATSN
ncbi:MAG: DUF4134 family protein [Mangrovibacterium sp.]